MAERTVRFDDIDGTDNAVERFFEFDGVMYTVDLGASSFSAMSHALEPFLAAATATEDRPTWARPRKTSRQIKGRQDAAEVRAWAVRQGIDVATTGRIASEVLSKYDVRC